MRYANYVSYFLFSAALVVLSNEFGQLYANDKADQLISATINIIAYCSEDEPQAERHLYILRTFRQATIDYRAKSQQPTSTPTESGVPLTSLFAQMDHSSLLQPSAKQEPPTRGRNSTSTGQLERSPEVPFDGSLMHSTKFQRSGSFSCMLDNITTDGIPHPGGEDQIDFGNLWSMPSTVPLGGPRSNLNAFQDVIDSPVPLFGMTNSS